METPESFEHFELLEVTEPLSMAQALQDVVDPLPDVNLKKEMSTPVLKFMNSRWEMRNQIINILGTIIGPDLNNPEVNTYHDFISGLALGFDYFEIELDNQPEFLITINVSQVLVIKESANKLTGPLTQKANFHVLVKEHPLLELAS